jgi:ABC-type proline/glycine betaine transport system substrate-binding protein
LAASTLIKLFVEMLKFQKKKPKQKTKNKKKKKKKKKTENIVITYWSQSWINNDYHIVFAIKFNPIAITFNFCGLPSLCENCMCNSFFGQGQLALKYELIYQVLKCTMVKRKSLIYACTMVEL